MALTDKEAYIHGMKKAREIQGEKLRSVTNKHEMINK